MTTPSGSDPGLAARLVAALGDRYRLLRELGSGGAAVVFLAEDLKHHRQVAVKVLRPDRSALLGPERFLREIEIVATLTHPHILPLHDSGEADGLLYYVMPYVEGPTLRSLLERRSYLPVAEAIPIALEVADALQFAHERGVVHRDIKPENILLEAGHAVVSDFGIARSGSPTTGAGRTEERMVVGTPRYMSPEQQAGAGPLDARSDVYSLGLVLYEMLAGEPPITGPSPISAATRRGAKPLRGLRGLRPAVARSIGRVLDRALATLPADRFPSAAAFAQALRQPVRRRRIVIAVGAGALVLGAVLARLILGAPAPHLNPHRIVVTVFTNQTDRPELDPLGTAAADWLITGLQQTGIFEVVPIDAALLASRSSTGGGTGRGGGATTTSLSGQTGAGLQVSGYYTIERDSLELRMLVYDAVQGQTAPIGPVKSALSRPEDVFKEARDRLMGFLAASVDQRLKAYLAQPARPPTYAAYLEASKGLDAYVRNDFAEAASRSRRAWEIDTTFAAPLLIASISVSNLFQYAAADSLLDLLERRRGRLSAFERHWLDYRRALMAGDHAAALAAVRQVAHEAPASKAVYNYALEAMQSGHLNEADTALRNLPSGGGLLREFVSYWDLLGTIRHLRGDHVAELNSARDAIRATPNRIFARVPAVRALAALGRLGEIESLLRDAKRLPSDPVASEATLLDEAAQELRAHGRPADAARFWERILLGMAGEAENRFLRASTLYALGRYADAVPLVDSLLAGAGSTAGYAGLRGVLAARLGDSATAARMERQLAGEPRRYALGGPELWRARIAAVLGRADSAVALLERAFAEGLQYDLWLHRDVDLESLRSNPRFVALVKPRD